MSARTKALSSLALIVAATYGASWLLRPWADAVALILLFGIAISSTLFALVYMLTRPWWETNIGRALLASTSSLSLLVNISLLYQWLGDDYAARDAVRLTVFALVLIGAVYKCVSLIYPERWRSDAARRSEGSNRV